MAAIIVFVLLVMFVFIDLPGLLPLFAALVFAFIFYVDAAPWLAMRKFRREIKNYERNS